MTGVTAIPQRTEITEVALCAWVAQAAPGEALEYHRGFLGIDRMPYGMPMSAVSRAALARTGDRAMHLAANGLVHLVQRRIARDTFSYLAVVRPRTGRTPLSATLLLAEEAA